MKYPEIRKFNSSEFSKNLKNIDWRPQGKVCKIVGNLIEAVLPNSQISTIAKIEIPNSKRQVLSEVVGFKGSKALLLPFSNTNGIQLGAKISGQCYLDEIFVGDHLHGKVIDPFLRCLNDKKSFNNFKSTKVPLDKDSPNPMSRPRINQPIQLGIRAIDGLLTFCEGQRIGIMAGSGVGKSVLMGMIARGSSSDVNVIGLIGERGREVREFIEKDLGEEGLKKSIVVVVTSDQSPLMRIRGAKVVTAIAEYFSSQGKKVLLMMDSLTRIAQAQREIGLAIGEPPTTKGYPPSVFSLLPKLLERCGQQSQHEGSISGIYTILADGDDFTDPIPDSSRAILDGHIILSRKLANKGHFPAIEVTSSVSRVMHDVVSENHLDLATKIRTLISIYEENIDLLQIGSYQEGSNPVLDLAVNLMPRIEDFLCQSMNENSDFSETMEKMIKIFQIHENIRKD